MTPVVFLRYGQRIIHVRDSQLYGPCATPSKHPSEVGER